MRAFAIDATKFLLLFAAYFFTAKWSLGFSAVAGFAAPLWPPSGIAFAALFLFGYRLWPAVFAAAALVNFITGAPVLVALAIGAGNALEALVAAYFLKKFSKGENILMSLRRASSFFASSVFLSASISPLMGLTALWLAGAVSGNALPLAWFSWWLGDALGILIVGYALIVWSTIFTRGKAAQWNGEVLAVFVVTVLTTILIFGNILPKIFPAISTGFPILYLIFIPLLWAALRLNESSLALVFILASLGAVWGTASGIGPLAISGDITDLVSLQFYIIVVASVGFMTHALSVERQVALTDARKIRTTLEQRVKERTEKSVEKVEEAETAKKAILNLLEDIAEEKQKTEEAAQKDEALIQSIGDAVVVVNASGKVEKINKATQDLLGKPSENFVGKHISEVLMLFEDERGEKAVASAERPTTEALLVGERVTARKFMKRANGTVFPVSVTAAPFLIDGKPRGAIALYRDTTKEYEIDKVKTEFVSLASHQLRTPLSTINWYAEMLLAGDAGKLTKDQKKYLDEIYTGNQRMVDLVNALLDVSRLELGTFVVEPTMIDLQDIAESVIKEQTPQIQTKKLTLKTSFEKDMPQVSADPKLIRIVFQNLLSNAVKYTPEGRKVEMSIKKETEFVKITVEDNGLGIPKEQQGRVFEKLFRADNVRATDTEGTGLGLYIIKSILEQSGGSIRFASPVATCKNAEGKDVPCGTAFYAELPLSGMKAKTGTRAIGE